MKSVKKYLGMKKVNPRTYFFFLGAASVIAVLFIFSSLFFVTNNPPSSRLEDEFPQGYKIVTPPIPDDITFAGEEIPVEDFEVMERIDREFIVNTYWHSSTIISNKRANRWFPVIEPILKKNNVPDDFKYLSVAESGLDNVISPAGATGFWQFMEGTAGKYGLEVNSEVDERYHVEKSTEAACQYLKDAYKKFGSWTLAAASYNMGMAGVNNQLGRQKVNNYYNLILNSETSRYIARIVAIKYILQDPEKYGFAIDEDEMYEPLDFEEVTVSGSVADFADYAAEYGINYKILKTYNPWLRDNSLSNRKGKTYRIKIPD